MLRLPKNIASIDSQLAKKITKTTYEHVEKQAKDFVRRAGLRLKAGGWMDDNGPAERFLLGDVGNFKILEDVQASSLFTPFIEKTVSSKDVCIAVIGDLHGDIETLVAILEKLRDNGYLNKQYHIIHPNFYFVFLGDYSNNKPHSVETMILLFHVYEQNIGRVFLLRGNHEYASENKAFYDECDFINNMNDAEAPETLIGEFARKFGVYYYPDLLYWYDYLPLTCYIGCRSHDGAVHYVQFSHSGLEIGFNPNRFLESSSCRFQKLTQLNRYQAIQDILKNKELEHLHNRVQFICNGIDDPSLQHVLSSYNCDEIIELDSPINMNHVRYGALWNNFLTESSDDIGFAMSFVSKNIILGKVLTRYFLEKFSGDSYDIVSIIRGHQQINECVNNINLQCNMLDDLIRYKGCLRQWDGLVYTFGDNGSLTGYQSFAVISFCKDLKKSTIQHFYKKRDGGDFLQKTFSLQGI
jgi:hypothetical protein